MNLLVFAGAGASAELAVPAMRTMAVELQEHLTRTGSATPLALRAKFPLVVSERLVDVVATAHFAPAERVAS